MAGKSMGTLTAYITANTNGFAKGVNGALGTLKNFAVAAGAAFATSQIVSFGSECLSLYQQQVQAERVLENAFKNSSSAAGLSVQDLKDYASELQSVTNYGDEEVMQLESELLSFGNIAGEQFKKAIELSMDMSAQLGGDATSNVKLLGKALADPLSGLTQLRRAGVVMTQEQTDEIKKLVEAGKLEEAQNKLLLELQQKFGGAARANVDPVKQLSNVWGDVKEQIGKVVVDSGLLDWLKKLTKWLADNQGSFAVWGTIVGNVFYNTGKVFFKTFEVLWNSIVTVGKTLWVLIIEPFELFGAMLADLWKVITLQMDFDEFGKRTSARFAKFGQDLADAVSSPWKDYDPDWGLRDLLDGVDDAVNKARGEKKKGGAGGGAGNGEGSGEGSRQAPPPVTVDSFNNATAATRGSLEAYRTRIEAGGQIKLLQQQLNVQQQINNKVQKQPGIMLAPITSLN